MKKNLDRNDQKSKLRAIFYSPRIYWWEWAAVGVVVLISLISSLYMDTVSLTIWSINLWDVIADGQFQNFYVYTSQNYHHLVHQYMGCDLFAIIPLSIWNFPIWIVQRFFDKDIAQSPGMLLWSKLGLEFCNCAIAYVGYKIALLVTGDKQRSLWSAIITIGSAVAAIGVGVAGQNDVFFILYGALSVYFMMKGKTKLSIIFAACSVAVKPFFIFAFLPLILLVEKNILIAAADCIGAMSLMGFNRLLGNVFPLYKESMTVGPTKEVLVNIFDVGIDAPYGKASAFMIGLMLLCFMSYMTKPSSKEERYKYLVYIAAGVFVMTSLFSKTEFYRSLTIMPYFSVLVISDKSRLRLNLLLSFLFQLAHGASRAMGSAKTVSAYYVGGTFVSKIFPQSEYANRPEASVRTILANSMEDGKLRLFLLSIVCAVMTIAAVALFIINHPRLSRKLMIEENGSEKNYDHGLLMLNSLVYLPFLIIMYSIYFYTPH